MRLQVLLSAMNLKDESFVDTLNITSDAVVVNQCSDQSPFADTILIDAADPAARDDNRDALSVERIRRENIRGKRHEIVFIESAAKGLSNSRNMAVRHADADICILCDNDVEYVDNYDRIIIKAFEKHKEADLIVFYIRRPEKPKPVFKSERRMGYLSVLKIFSPEIAFRRERLKDIHFDPLFGAGAKYPMGEENIFLYECLKRKLKIIYVPVMIAQLRDEQSTWFKGYDRGFFIARGAGYTAMSPRLSWLLILQYAVRKYKLYKDSTSFRNAVKFMLEGKRSYEKDPHGR